MDEETRQQQQQQPKAPRKTTILGNLEIKRPKTLGDLMLWVAVGIALGWVIHWGLSYAIALIILLSISVAYLLPVVVIAWLVWFFVLRGRNKE